MEDPIQEEQPQEELTIKEKEKEIEKQKRQFYLVLRTFKFIGLSVIGLSILIVVITKLTRKTFPTVVVGPEPEINKPEKPESTIDHSEREIYKSEELRLSFEYPTTARIETDYTQDFTKKVEVIYEEEGKEGYIFRISTFTTGARDLEEVTRIKKDSFVVRCPETADISEISDSYVDGIASKEFEVLNCDSNYNITYTPRFYQYYEFARVYKGDYGYRQQYNNITADILDSIRFYPEEIEPQPDLPYNIFTSEKYNFTLHYPKLDENCCDITGPRSENAKRIAQMYDKDTYMNEAEYNGIGIFVDEFDPKMSFEDYMETEKQRLVDDYVIIRGANPNTSEENIDIGEQEGVYLKGYTWERNNLVYIHVERSRYTNNMAVVISIRNQIDNGFEEEVIELLTDSFELVENDN